MIPGKLRTWLIGSVRRQLITGVAVVHAVMMSLFIWDLTTRQQAMLLDQQTSQARALAQSVATSSAGWLVARDLTGLQEIIEAQKRYPELRFAMALDREGAVLAHTDRQYLGSYLGDLPERPRLAMLHRTPALVDVVSPAMVAGQHVGWVRIGVGQRGASAQLAAITRDGILYALAAILVGALLAGIMGTRLTRRLYAIRSVADAVKAGHTDRRAPDEGNDEAAGLARQFNEMLDTVAQRERELIASHAALHQSEARFQRAMRGASDGLWDWDLRSDHVFYSPRWKAMLGYREDELEDHFSTWERLVEAEGRERTLAIIRECLDGKREIFESEFRMRHKDGHWVHILARGYLERDAEGRPLRLTGTHVDLTERKRVEEALQLTQFAVDQSRDGVFWVDMAGRVTRVNGQACRSLGYGQDELTGMHIWDFDPDFPRADWLSLFARMRREGVVIFETRHRRKDGTTFPVEISASYIRFGEKEYGFSFVRDITERKRAEEALRRLNEELEERVEQRTMELVAAKEEAERASRAKSEFLSRMSHELRTPLNAILGFGQLLELEAREAEQADNVREILHAGHHLLELINEVLDLARIESGKMTVSLEPVHLAAIIEECVTLAQPLAEARGIRIGESGRDCGGSVRADRTRLKQVLLNLLSNAIKYNRRQGTVGIACVPVGDAIRIRVSDTGAGLTPEQQARLFVAFERLDADKAAIEGTGIGLALSKRLMELMAGEIGVESEVGAGSTFWLQLPGEEAAADVPLPPVGAAQGPAGRPVPMHTSDVLCIEDNPANLRLVERILARRSHIRLLGASAPGLGLELAAAHRPALILLDINLPDMDGYEVMKRLRENPATRAIPVVAVSANAMPKDLERGKAAGFADYLTKPLEMERLLRVVDEIIAGDLVQRRD